MTAYLAVGLGLAAIFFGLGGLAGVALTAYAFNMGYNKDPRR